MKEINITFGPVDFKIAIENSLGYLSRYFNDWFITSDDKLPVLDNIDATFHLSVKADLPKDCLHFSDGRAWSVYLDKNDDGELHIYCIPHPVGHMKIIKLLPSFLIKPLLNDAPSFKYLQASYFLYNVLVPIAEMQLLKKDCTFIHSSSVSSSDGSFLFTGLGGTGKTSISSYLYLRKESKFGCLGDDLSIVSGDGQVFLNPMPMNVYPYNVETFPELGKYVKSSLSFFEKFLWKTRSSILGSKAAMKRVSIPKNRVKTSKDKINAIYYLERSDVDNIRIDQITAGEVSFVSKNILLGELSSKMSLFVSANTRIEKRNILNIPTIEELSLNTEEIYNAALKDKSVYKVSIPMSMNTVELGESIQEILDKKHV